MSPPRRGIHNTSSKQKFRQKPRKSLTPAEASLWTHLKGHQLSGQKFRRQASIGRYIVDFYCPESRLVVELDGERHYSVTIDEYESQRTAYLEGQGLKIVRFENKDVFESLDLVLEEIRKHLRIDSSS